MPRLVALAALLLLVARVYGQTPASTAPTLQPGPGEDLATVQADSVVSIVENGVAVQRLFSTRGGIVAVQQGTTTVTAAEAVVTGTPGRRTVVLTGAVRILQGTDLVEAPTVRYEEASKTGVATGGVRLSNTDVNVESAAVRYDARTKRADFDQPVRLVTIEDGSVLTAARGVYFSQTKRADFVGNVRLVDEQTVLTAERGTYQTDTKQADFSGNVRLVDGSSTLTAAEGTYDRTVKMATFEGDVQLQDSSATLTAERGTYDRTASLATFEGDVQLQDSVSTLTAERGTYDRTRRFATFDGNVQLVDSTSVLTAERGTYDRVEERADFEGSVQLTRRNARDGTDAQDDVYAERLVYERRDERSVANGGFRFDRTEADSTGVVRVRTILLGGAIRNDDRAGSTASEQVEGGPEPLLVRIAYPPLADSTATPDTLVLRAQAFRLDRTAATDSTDAEQRLKARGQVRVWTSAYAALADSLFSRRAGPEGRERDSVRLLRTGGPQPLGFLRRAQVSSDTLVLVAEGGEARRLYALGGAFVAEQDSATGRFQQAKGQRLDGTFEDGDRRRFVLGPQAELLFFRSTDGRPDGAVRASGDRAVLVSKGDSLEALDVYDGVEGQYIPENLNAATQRLDGFDWKADRRPTFDALTDGYAVPRLERPPSRPPSQRTETGAGR
ncbi:MAG: hypothetical protein LCH53_09400 [Bacteroidetes bacterium]|nr:hypothetical protein [Bacteroidota bacterium]